MKVTAIMNLKGGTAKTVTAINLAAILRKCHDQRVLLVDADSQCNLTEFMTGELPEDQRKTKGGFYDLLTGKEAVCLRPTVVKGVEILPATDDLMSLDIGSSGKGADPEALASFRKEIDDMFDFMLIDCPPAFSASSAAALLAADQVIVPMKLDAFGIRGMTNLLQQVINMKTVNPDLAVAGILPTMYYKSEQMDEAETMLRQVGLPVFHHIRRSVMVDNMTFRQRPLIETSPLSGACRDYKAFAAEFLKGGGKYGL